MHVLGTMESEYAGRITMEKNFGLSFVGLRDLDLRPRPQNNPASTVANLRSGLSICVYLLLCVFYANKHVH